MFQMKYLVLIGPKYCIWINKCAAHITFSKFCICFENSVDPDLLASNEASWSRYTQFLIHINNGVTPLVWLELGRSVWSIKLQIISYPSDLTFVLGAQKNVFLVPTTYVWVEK